MKSYIFSETYENYTIDDYIKEGDDGPWYAVVSKERSDKLAEALLEIINTKSMNEESNYLAQHFKVIAEQALIEYKRKG